AYVQAPLYLHVAMDVAGRLRRPGRLGCDASDNDISYTFIHSYSDDDPSHAHCDDDTPSYRDQAAYCYPGTARMPEAARRLRPGRDQWLDSKPAHAGDAGTCLGTLRGRTADHQLCHHPGQLP